MIRKAPETRKVSGALAVPGPLEALARHQHERQSYVSGNPAEPYFRICRRGVGGVAACEVHGSAVGVIHPRDVGDAGIRQFSFERQPRAREFARHPWKAARSGCPIGLDGQGHAACRGFDDRSNVVVEPTGRSVRHDDFPSLRLVPVRDLRIDPDEPGGRGLDRRFAGSPGRIRPEAVAGRRSAEGPHGVVPGRDVPRGFAPGRNSRCMHVRWGLACNAGQATTHSAGFKADMSDLPIPWTPIPADESAKIELDSFPKRA